MKRGTVAPLMVTWALSAVLIGTGVATNQDGLVAFGIGAVAGLSLSGSV